MYISPAAMPNAIAGSLKARCADLVKSTLFGGPASDNVACHWTLDRTESGNLAYSVVIKFAHSREIERQYLPDILDELAANVAKSGWFVRVSGCYMWICSADIDSVLVEDVDEEDEDEDEDEDDFEVDEDEGEDEEDNGEDEGEDEEDDGEDEGEEDEGEDEFEDEDDFEVDEDEDDDFEDDDTSTTYSNIRCFYPDSTVAKPECESGE